MFKITTAKTLIELFNIILTGNKNDSRRAAREARKMLYGSQGGKEKYKDIENLVNSAPHEYAQISEDWRQENFVTALSVLYFLHGKEHQPDFLFPWLLHLLQHQNGNIRQAAVRMMENELGPLTVYIRCPGFKADGFNHIKPEQADFILLNLFKDLNNLLANLWKPEYKRYKHVSSLPTCPYKSAQMVLSKMEDICGEKSF